MSNDLLIDKRIIERNIKRGRLDAGEYRSLLEGLPDLRGQLWQRPESRAPEREPAAPIAQPQPQSQPIAEPAAIGHGYAASEPAASASASESESEAAAPLPPQSHTSPFG